MILDISPTPPIAAKSSFTSTQLGRERTDDYSWLKADNWQEVMSDPSVLPADIRKHLEAENAFTKNVLAPIEALKDTIFEEMKARLEPQEESVPDPDGAYAYGHRYREGDQHGLYVRYPNDPATWPPTDFIDGDAGREQESVLLDADELARESKGFFNLGDVEHSPDHKWLAYTVDRQGSERFEIFAKPATAPLSETHALGIANAKPGLVWGRDSETVYWVEVDDNQRPFRVRRKPIHADGKGEIVYTESDPGFFVSVSESDSGKYVEVSAHNHTTTEIWRIDAHDPSGKAVCFREREDGVEYSLHERGDEVFILTNINGAVDFKIMKTRDHAPEKWEEFVPHTPGRLILSLTAYKDYLTSLERESALPRIRVYDLASDTQNEIAMDEEAYALGLRDSLEFETDTVRYSYSSPTTPSTLYSYDMSTGERTPLKRQSIPSGHDPDGYETRRLTVTARDGAEVPVTLLYKAGTKPDGSNPCLLYGYGSYGITIPAGFRTTVLSLVDRGFVYAIAHIRGSMAKGYGWYLDGKLEKKSNTFNDFVDCAKALFDEGWTAEGRIVAHGGSAGGLLVGAAINQAPELFGGAIAAVPFVDALNTMSDETLPLTPPEWPEWGNPLEDEAAYDDIASWSPYDNIRRAPYPPVLATAGLTDPRVTYWEPAKWVAKLREHTSGDAPILLKTNMEAGHQGESGRYDRLKELALEYAFAVAVVGNPIGNP